MQERYWAAVVPEERFAEERLFSREAIFVRPAPGADAPRPGELVVMIAATEPPVVFGLGRVDPPTPNASADGGVRTRYTHRLLDEPLPAPDVPRAAGLHPLDRDAYARLADPVGADRRTDADKSEWFVSVALPIEAPTAAEAVREFWSYVDKLGPRELPAFVWPRADELAMQAFVLGTEANLDPEEDDD